MKQREGPLIASTPEMTPKISNTRHKAESMWSTASPDAVPGGNGLLERPVEELKSSWKSDSRPAGASFAMSQRSITHESAEEPKVGGIAEPTATLQERTEWEMTLRSRADPDPIKSIEGGADWRELMPRGVGGQVATVSDAPTDLRQSDRLAAVPPSPPIVVSRGRAKKMEGSSHQGGKVMAEERDEPGRLLTAPAQVTPSPDARRSNTAIIGTTGSNTFSEWATNHVSDDEPLDMIDDCCTPMFDEGSDAIGASEGRLELVSSPDPDWEERISLSVPDRDVTPRMSNRSASLRNAPPVLIPDLSHPAETVTTLALAEPSGGEKKEKRREKKRKSKKSKQLSKKDLEIIEQKLAILEANRAPSPHPWDPYSFLFPNGQSKSEDTDEKEQEVTHDASRAAPPQKVSGDMWSSFRF